MVELSDKIETEVSLPPQDPQPKSVKQINGNLSIKYYFRFILLVGYTLFLTHHAPNWTQIDREPHERNVSDIPIFFEKLPYKLDYP